MNKKEEFYLSETFASHREAAKHVVDSIDIYNNQRPHLTCQMMTPEIAHHCSTLSPRSRKRKTKKGPQPEAVSPETFT